MSNNCTTYDLPLATYDFPLTTFPLKTCILIFLLLFSVTWLHAQDDHIPARPNPPRLVNDFAGVLSPDERASLESKLVAYNDSTSTQFAIVIIRTYGIYDRADYTFRLANKWQIGQKGKNNGLLITVAVDDRKYFIATGYGLEGSIPDAVARRVGEQYFKPNFRANNYYQGLDDATTYLASLPADEFKAEARGSGSGGGGGWWFIIVLLLIFVVLPLIFRGGGRGGRGGGYRGGGGYTPPFIIFGSGGSSSSWGGGGGSGGFGGFGGGSFGGGGAGGDW
jgi:uncharacterized protein